MGGHRKCQNVINAMITFKHTTTLKNVYSEQSYTHHLESVINILLYLLYHMFYPLLSIFKKSNSGAIQKSTKKCPSERRELQSHYNPNININYS